MDIVEEIKKLVETWKTEKGSFIPNAPIYGMFIKELEEAIKRQEQINKLTIPDVVEQSEQLICSRCNETKKQETNDPYCLECKIEIESTQLPITRN